MPLENTLNVNPYFDDFDPAKEYYRILFKPGVAVQTRELNQLQSLLQNQIERFGNHVFKSGTIVSGVNFTYLPNYNYVKILDTQGDGQPSLPSSYVGYFVKDTNTLTARVVNYQDGLESQAPDMKTLYIQYVSASNSACTTFVADQQLTVFSKDNDLFKITVNNGGAGFSNSDTVIVHGALVLTDNTGTYSVGEEITQATTGAKAIIKAVNTTAIANTLILSIKPRTADLKNTAVTSAAWTFVPGYNIVSNTTVTTANVSSVIGEGAIGLITTDSLGIIQTITMSERGKDYTFLPHVTVQTSNTSATVNDLDLIPQNYLTTVTVANSSVNSVGAGYAFAVSEGIIYQKGLFLTVNNSVIVVDKYNTSPNNVVVGFKTVETFVDADEDDTLYDNASNTTNYSAPGADRLKLTPSLVKLTTEQAAANVDFFALAEWKEGVPYKENRVTVYNTLANEFARRTREAQGDYVVDPFYVSSREKATTNTTYVDAVIDPGTAYISGYRVQTLNNGLLDIERSTTTSNTENQTISVNYGNYLEVKELAGIFNFKTGDQISLRDTAKQYITNATINTGAITAPGSQIGTARIRSLVLASGLPGTANAVYRLYLFDVTMSAGKSFRDVRAVYYDGATHDGVADVVLTLDATSNENIALLQDINRNKMLFGLGQVALSNVTNVTYTIRTNSDTNYQMTTGGTITVGPLGSGETFPYGDGTLGTTQKRDIIVIPIANSQTANVTGGVTTYANTTVDGTSTTFTSSFIAGDFVAIANSTATIYRQIASVANNTKMFLTTNGVAMSGNAANFYPALYPIALADRTDRSAAISASSKTLTITMNKTLTSTVNVAVIFNKTLTAQSPVTKSVTRNVYVKVHTSNNAGSNTGPWALGVPGALRLKNVYLGNSTVVNTSSTDVTKYFFIDTGEDENAYRTSQLVLRRGATLSIDTNSLILVKFDAFRSSAEGFFTVGSYTINDTANLASLTSNQVNTLEIPEVVTSIGEYYDHRDIIDFRPYASNTAALATSVATANVNPSNTFALSGSDQLWPAPDSTVAFDARYYNKRIDRVTVNKDGQFKIIQGTPGVISVKPPTSQAGEITLSLLSVPQYPSIPTMMSTDTLEIASKKIGNGRGIVDKRTKLHTIAPYLENGVAVSQPRRYSMADIGKLERRIQNVEFISNLNQVEKAVKEKVIPSSITPSTSRFKHGFFVEPFEDYARVDADNVEFNASIDGELGLLKPATKQINFECSFDTADANTAGGIVNATTLMLPYNHEILIDQTIKSAVVSSAGVRTQFIGEGTVAPPTFSIKTRGIVEEIPDPVNYDGAGTTTNTGGGGCGSCFTADTLVEMADGTMKRIIDVLVGDFVKSADGISVNEVTFIERATSETYTQLYTPSNKLPPFATVNHPLMIDGVWKAPVADTYIWLDVEPLDKCKIADNEEEFVYNLWVKGDGTYRVNGYGTTSIVGDGGALTNAVNMGILTADQASAIIADMTLSSRTGLYGAYLINKFFSSFDTPLVLKPLTYFATAPRNTLRRSLFSFATEVVGHIAKVLKV